MGVPYSFATEVRKSLYLCRPLACDWSSREAVQAVRVFVISGPEISLKEEFSRADRGVHPQYKREREKEWLRNRLVPSGLVELLLGLSPNNLRRLRK